MNEFICVPTPELCPGDMVTVGTFSKHIALVVSVSTLGEYAYDYIVCMLLPNGTISHKMHTKGFKFRRINL